MEEQHDQMACASQLVQAGGIIGGIQTVPGPADIGLLVRALDTFR
jgi:hypothetical protein